MKISFLSIAAMALIFFNACVKPQETPNAEIDSSAFSEAKSLSEIAFLEDVTKTKIHINSQNEIQKVEYGDAVMEIVYLDSSHAILTGSFLRGDSIGLHSQNPNEIQFYDVTFNRPLPSINFINMVSIGGSYVLAAPCDDHPLNQTFNDCFKQEWDDFCDGIFGCVVLALHPVSISALFAGHCAACVTQ